MRGALCMSSLSALATSRTGFFRGEFVSRALGVGGPPPLAGNRPLLGWVHGGKSA